MPETKKPGEETLLSKEMKRFWAPFKADPELYTDPNKMYAIWLAARREQLEITKIWEKWQYSIDSSARDRLRVELQRYAKRMALYKAKLESTPEIFQAYGVEDGRKWVFDNLTLGLVLAQRDPELPKWRRTDTVPDGLWSIYFRRQIGVGMQAYAHAFNMLIDDIGERTNELVLKPLVALGEGIAKTVKATGSHMGWIAAVGATVVGGVVVWAVTKKLEGK